jgi:hypothetical protein
MTEIQSRYSIIPAMLHDKLHKVFSESLCEEYNPERSAYLMRSILFLKPCPLFSLSPDLFISKKFTPYQSNAHQSSALYHQVV